MRTRINNESGMSLIEVLVATAILAIAILAILGIYDAARGAFKKGENAAGQQESVRIAYDRITADLRMLGFNANPDGNVARLDEQLEVALDHAIIFRGDFDAEDATKKSDHEVALAGGAFDVVSTGNDEVVGYVLSRPDGTGPDTITFQADVDDQPRDGNVTTVTVNNVVLNPTSPPYTLYKISLNNNVATCCSGDFIVRTPVAENMRNLTFQYYDPTSTAAIAAPGSTETATVKATRDGVTRFNVSLIGMTKDSDMRYNDASDPAASTYRKFELRGDVVPRNMRLKGAQDLAAIAAPPSQPATPTLVAGHCGGLLATWTPNASREGVVGYKVNYGTTAGVPNATQDAGSSPFFISGLATGTTYYVSIQAVDAKGNASTRSAEASAPVTNTNTPSPPTGGSATTGQTNHVRLSWTAVTTNSASVPPGDPSAPAIRDLAGYRIYRGDAASLTTVLANRIADESVVRAPNEPPHDDTAAINCHTYYYKLTAVDTCGTESTASSAVSGSATTAIAPAAPTNVTVSAPAASKAIVSWTPVTKDASGNPITIGAYDIYRSTPGLKGRSLASVTWPGSPTASSTTPTYTDNAVPAMFWFQSVFYAVKAKDECVNYSALSSGTERICAFSGTVMINPPVDGTNVAGVVPVTVTMSGGTDTYTGVTITYTHSVSGVTRTYISNTAGTTWTDNGWLASPVGSYTITAVVTNSTGCSAANSVTVTSGSSVGCCLSTYPTTATTISCASGAAKCKQVSYQLGNDRCLTAVSVTSMSVAWTDYSGRKPRWQTAQFNGVNIAGVGSWTTTYAGATNEAGTATKSNFGAPAPQVNYLTPMTAGNTTKVTYVFNNFTDSGSGGSRKVDVFSTNQYIFTLLDSAGNPSGITTTCSLQSLVVN